MNRIECNLCIKYEVSSQLKLPHLLPDQQLHGRLLYLSTAFLYGRWVCLVSTIRLL